MSLSCIILDDDLVSITILKKMISDYSDFTVSAYFQKPLDAIHYIKNNSVDVLFLDIELGEINGIELIDELPKNIITILVSAHDEYGIQAFNASVSDYLLKPIDKTRFIRTISKINESKKNLKDASNIVDDSIFIRKNDVYVKVFTKDILYLKSDGDYIEIHTHQAKYLIIGSMDSILQKLKSTDFIRVHRSFAVALSKIDSMQDNDLYLGKQLIPVSKTYLKVVKDRLNIL
ncbi:response regulator transcription factor [bacterium]|nr:MAG: response regulator transcription factor [bacterium]